MNRILNDMVTSNVDHYRVQWGGVRSFMDSGSGKFHAPVGADPRWLVAQFNPPFSRTRRLPNALKAATG